MTIGYRHTAKNVVFSFRHEGTDTVLVLTTPTATEEVRFYEGDQFSKDDLWKRIAAAEYAVAF